MCVCVTVDRSDELRDELDKHQESLRQIETNLDEAQGEKAAKLKELKAKEDERQGKKKNIHVHVHVHKINFELYRLYRQF